MRFLVYLATFMVAMFCMLLIAFVVLKPKLDREIRSLVKRTAGTSFEIKYFNYGKAHLSGLGIVFEEIQARGITHIDHPYFDPREFELTIPRIHVRFEKWTPHFFRVHVRILGLEVKGGRRLKEDREDGERLESVSQVNFETTFEFRGWPTHWKEQLIKRAKEFKAWIFDDQAIRAVEIKGKAVFIVDDWPITVHFFSVQSKNAAVHLECEREDLRVIVEMIEPKFTEADLILASRNLLKGPKLLRFRKAAEAQAMRLKGRDSEIQYDAPRHIYWSYYLTKAYGKDFARAATDAHEIGDALNTAEESAKDQHHNALGIEFAEKGLSEAEVEKLIFTDSRVYRLRSSSSAEKVSRQAVA